MDKKLKSRELPEHIKREVDEFEFDDEIEFDEELRKLRKESKLKKKVVEEVDVSSPEDFSKSKTTVRSRSNSFSKPSHSHSPSKSPGKNVEPIDVDMKDGIVINSPDPTKIDSEDGIPTLVDKKVETVPLQYPEKDGDEKILDNMLPSNVDEKPTAVEKCENGEVSSTLTSPAVEENAAKPTEVKPKKKTKIIKKKVIRIIKVARKKQKSTSGTSINTPETPTEVPISAGTPISAETSEPVVVADVTIGGEVDNEDASKSEINDSVIEIQPPVSQEKEIFDNSVVVTDQPLPENSRWETSGKPMQSSISVHRSKTNETPKSSSPIKKPKTLDIDGIVLLDGTSKGEKKKARNPEKAAEKTDSAKVKSTISKERLFALKQMHVHKSEARAKKEAEKAKRTSIEKVKSDGKEGNVEDEERRRRREKYILKQRRAKERALARKMESDSDTVKSKVKVKRNETDHGEGHAVVDEDKCIPSDRKSDQGSYKPADAKLKSISEITKKRLKQGDIGEPKKNEIEDEGSDVLKSKVTSIKTVIAAAKKRRVIKTSVSEEERELTTPMLLPEEHHVRRIVKIDDRKKSLVSKVEKLASSTEKSITIRGEHDKRRHREEEMERRRREKSLEREREEVLERDRYERRVRLREEENLRREVKEKVRLREIEKERQQREKEEQQRVKSLEKEKLESLERERQALKEKDKLERKLKRERQLREEMIREKEEKDDKDRKRKDEGEKKRQDKRRVTVANENSDSGNSDGNKNIKRGKRDKSKPGYIIQIIDSDKSDTDSESTEDEDRDKKKKKKSKRKREKKRKKKVRFDLSFQRDSEFNLDIKN